MTGGQEDRHSLVWAGQADAARAQAAYRSRSTTNSPVAVLDSMNSGNSGTRTVTVTVRVPLLPEFIESNTATGLFVVERDRYAA